MEKCFGSIPIFVCSAFLLANVDQIRKDIGQIRTTYKIPGLSVLLIQDETEVLEAHFGYANIDENRPVDSQTLFNIGSCSKAFIGLGFLLLEEEGRQLESMYVRDIVPEVQIHNPWFKTSPISIAHLLEHSAGFEDIRLHSLVNPNMGQRDLLKVLQAKKELREIRWEPGSRKAYSSPGYTLAAYILGEVTNSSYEQFLSAQLLSPLDMSNTYFHFSDIKNGLLASAYHSGREIDPIVGFDWPCGLLLTNLDDLKKFVRFLLGFREEVLSPSSLEKLGVPTTTLASKNGLQYGYNFGATKSFNHNAWWIGHSGGGPGCMARIAFSPEIAAGYVILGNSFSHPALMDLRDTIETYLVKPRPEWNKAKNYAPPDTRKDLPVEYLGCYQSQVSRQKLMDPVEAIFGGIELQKSGDNLVLNESFGKQDEISIQSSRFIVKSDDTVPFLVLSKTESGTPILIGPNHYYLKSSFNQIVLYKVLGVVLGFGLLLSPLLSLWSVIIRVVRYFKKTSTKMQSFAITPELFSTLGLFILIVGIITLSKHPIESLGLKTIYAQLFYWSSILFLVLSFSGLINLLMSHQCRKEPIRGMLRFFSIASYCATSLVFMNWGYIGLQIWCY